MGRKQSEKTRDNILNILLQCPRWIPLSGLSFLSERRLIISDFMQLKAFIQTESAYQRDR